MTDTKTETALSSDPTEVRRQKLGQLRETLNEVYPAHFHRTMTNAELAARIDTSDEWIVQRTGIKQRHIAAEGEFTSHLAINAGRRSIIPLNNRRAWS